MTSGVSPTGAVEYLLVELRVLVCMRFVQGGNSIVYTRK